MRLRRRSDGEPERRQAAAAAAENMRTRARAFSLVIEDAENPQTTTRRALALNAQLSNPHPGFATAPRHYPVAVIDDEAMKDPG
jgi:hypothetical protein